MKTQTKTYYVIYGLLFAVLITGFICSSFYDFQISSSIVNQNSTFGMICASFGELPAWALMSFFGVMAFRLSQQVEKKTYKVLLIFFFVLVVGVSSYMIFSCMNSSHNGFKDVSNLALRIILTVIFEGLIVALAFFLVRTKDTKLLIRIWLIMMISYYSGLGLTYLLKGIFSRPRYRLICNGFENYSPIDLFKPWFNMKKGLAEEMLAAQIGSDEFNSFPSGHTFDALSGILFFYVPFLNDKTKDKKWIRYAVLSFFSLYGLMIGFGRIYYGAHYLSDVTIGGLIIVVLSFIIPLVDRKIRKNPI